MKMALTLMALVSTAMALAIFLHTRQQKHVRLVVNEAIEQRIKELDEYRRAVRDGESAESFKIYLDELHSLETVKDEESRREAAIAILGDRLKNLLLLLEGSKNIPAAKASDVLERWQNEKQQVIDNLKLLRS
ncbi:MAG: hypothetical protein RL095_2722 [Verrucomicrobiota bacterium]|jgi:hypothetical protein